MTITIVPRHVSSARSDDAWRKAGDWLQRHQGAIRTVQWTMVVLYGVLLIVPVFLPLPDRAAYLWTNFTRFAQFIFWGIWWPLVLLTTALVGRIWCGIVCPEGAITEFASRYGYGKAIPRWLTWPGWPTLAFASTTLYGQMTSVYQYPAPTLLILGGSTLAAALVGFFYGRNKRVWCRYLCPVSGVFGLLAKLAPLHFRVDPPLWQLSQLSGVKPKSLNCAPLVPIRTMRGASDCHMCGRCSGFRGAIRLARRSPNHEIVHVAGAVAKPWETVLIVAGLMGLAAGAFQWSISPWFVCAKIWMAERLMEYGVTWPLETTAPWWILTNYPGDVMTSLDGVLLIAYMLAVAVAYGASTLLLLALATRSLGPWQTRRLHHLAQSLIPLAGAGVFLGLSGLTVSQLRSDGIVLPFIGMLRALILTMATFWSGTLCWQVTGIYNQEPVRRMLALSLIGLAMMLGVAGWILLFWIW